MDVCEAQTPAGSAAVPGPSGENVRAACQNPFSDDVLGTHTCPFCQLIVADAKALQSHISEHLSEVFKSRRPNKHIKRRATTYDCEVCGLTQKNLPILERHMKINHQVDLPRCNICSKLYPNSKELIKHMNQHDASIRMNCELCEVKFENASELTKHLIEHLGHTSKKCPVCFNVYSSNSTVKKHMRIHSGERPHRCSICDMYFFQEWDVARHVLTKGHSAKKAELRRKGKPAIEPVINPKLMVTAKHSYFRLITKPATHKANELKRRAVQQPHLPRQGTSHNGFKHLNDKKGKVKSRKKRDHAFHANNTSRSTIIRERYRRNRKVVNYAKLDDLSSDEDDRYEPRRDTNNLHPPSLPCDRVEIEMDVDESPAGVISSMGASTIIAPMTQSSLNTQKHNHLPHQNNTYNTLPHQNNTYNTLPHQNNTYNTLPHQNNNYTNIAGPSEEVDQKPLIGIKMAGNLAGGKLDREGVKEGGGELSKNLRYDVSENVTRETKLMNSSVGNASNGLYSGTIMDSLRPIAKVDVPSSSSAVPSKSEATYSAVRPAVYTRLTPSTAGVKEEPAAVASDIQTLLERAEKRGERVEALMGGESKPFSITIESDSDDGQNDDHATDGSKFLHDDKKRENSGKPFTLKTEQIFEDEEEGGQEANLTLQVVNDSHLAKNNNQPGEGMAISSSKSPALPVRKGEGAETTCETIFQKKVDPVKYETVEILSDDEQSEQERTLPKKELSNGHDSAPKQSDARQNIKMLEISSVITIDSDSEDENDQRANSQIKTEKDSDDEMLVSVKEEVDDGASANNSNDGVSSRPVVKSEGECERVGSGGRWGVEGQQSVYMCVECDMEFGSQELLDKHIPLHEEDSDPSALTILQDDGAVTYMCFKCCEIYRSKESLEQHKPICPKL